MGSSDGEGSIRSEDLEAWRVAEEEERRNDLWLRENRYSKEETGYGSNYTDSELSERSFEQYEDYSLEELERKVEVANCTIAYLGDENSTLERKVASLEAEKAELAEMNRKLRNDNEELDLRVQCLEEETKELEENHEVFGEEHAALVERVSKLLNKVTLLENENKELADRVILLSIESVRATIARDVIMMNYVTISTLLMLWFTSLHR